jgi:hypothetical protein
MWWRFWYLLLRSRPTVILCHKRSAYDTPQVLIGRKAEKELVDRARRSWRGSNSQPGKERVANFGECRQVSRAMG